MYYGLKRDNRGVAMSGIEAPKPIHDDAYEGKYLDFTPCTQEEYEAAFPKPDPMPDPEPTPPRDPLAELQDQVNAMAEYILSKEN